jgi:hypothetical protein
MTRDHMTSKRYFHNDLDVVMLYKVWEHNAVTR